MLQYECIEIGSISLLYNKCKPPSCNIYPISLEQYEALYILVSRVIRGRLRHLLDQAGGLCASPHGQPWGNSHKSLRPQWEENIPAQSSRFRLQQHISCFSTYPESPPACKSVPNPHLRLPSHYRYVAQGARLPTPSLLSHKWRKKHFTRSKLALQSFLFRGNCKFFVPGFANAVVVAPKSLFAGLGYGQSSPRVGVSK